MDALLQLEEPHGGPLLAYFLQLGSPTPVRGLWKVPHPLTAAWHADWYLNSYALYVLWWLQYKSFVLKFMCEEDQPYNLFVGLFIWLKKLRPLSELLDLFSRIWVTQRDINARFFCPVGFSLIIGTQMLRLKDLIFLHSRRYSCFSLNPCCKL